jgi:hypothetical protein
VGLLPGSGQAHIEVRPDTPGRLDVRLELGNWGGCCEYAAPPMKISPDSIDRKKPFDYRVGEGDDDGTLRGIANERNPKAGVRRQAGE